MLHQTCGGAILPMLLAPFRARSAHIVVAWPIAVRAVPGLAIRLKRLSITARKTQCALTSRGRKKSAIAILEIAGGAARHLIAEDAHKA